MATTSDLTIIKKHILTKAQYEALETIEPNDEYYVIDDDGGSVKYSNEQALTDEQKATAQKNIGVDTTLSSLQTDVESINTDIADLQNNVEDIYTSLDNIDTQAIKSIDKIEDGSILYSDSAFPGQYGDKVSYSAIYTNDNGEYLKREDLTHITFDFSNQPSSSYPYKSLLLQCCNKGYKPIYNDGDYVFSNFDTEEAKFYDNQGLSCNLEYSQFWLGLDQSYCYDNLEITSATFIVCPTYDLNTYEASEITLEFRCEDSNGEVGYRLYKLSASNTSEIPEFKDITLTLDKLQVPSLNENGEVLYVNRETPLSNFKNIQVLRYDTSVNPSAIIKQIKLNGTCEHPYLGVLNMFPLWKIISRDDIKVEDTVEPTEAYKDHHYRDSEDSSLHIINESPQSSGYAQVISGDEITEGYYAITYLPTDGSAAWVFDGSRVDKDLDTTQNFIYCDYQESDNPKRLQLLLSQDSTSVFQITKSENEGFWNIKSNSGYYIGRTATSNGMNTSQSTAYDVTISIADDNTAVITSSGGPKLQAYTTTDGKRFRFYKSTQKPINLFRLQEASPYEWDKTVRKSELAKVAITNDYKDLDQKPELGQVIINNADVLPIINDSYDNVMVRIGSDLFSVVKGQGIRWNFQTYPHNSCDAEYLVDFTKQILNGVKYFHANSFRTNGYVGPIKNIGVQMGSSKKYGQISINHQIITISKISVYASKYKSSEAFKLIVEVSDQQTGNLLASNYIDLTSADSPYSGSCEVVLDIPHTINVNVYTDATSGRRGILNSIIWEDAYHPHTGKYFYNNKQWVKSSINITDIPQPIEYTAGENINITDNAISAVGYKYDPNLNSIAVNSARVNGPSSLASGDYSQAGKLSFVSGSDTYAHELSTATNQYSYAYDRSSALGFKTKTEVHSHSNGTGTFVSPENASENDATRPTYDFKITSMTDTQLSLNVDTHSDDVAYIGLGGQYRTPTVAEWKELTDNCTWTWTDNYNNTGVAGEIVVASNGNSIFLPAAGQFSQNVLSNSGIFGFYWTRQLRTNFISDAQAVVLKSNGMSTQYINRYMGCTVRPVSDSDSGVDLGLSVRWAPYNAGASKSEESGIYVAWGETEPKESYSWDTYKWGTSDNLTKYNGSDFNTLESIDDAAISYSTGNRRIPTKDEWQELINNATWTWVTKTNSMGNSCNGYEVEGPGGKIFLPAAGQRDIDGLGAVGIMGRYWTSSLYTFDPDVTCDIYLVQGNVSVGNYYRYCGQSVRSVSDTHGIDVLGNGIYWSTCNVGSAYPLQYGNYYAWGETKPKSNYSWETYKWCNGTQNTLTKYCNNSSYGIVDNLTELERNYVNTSLWKTAQAVYFGETKNNQKFYNTWVIPISSITVNDNNVTVNTWKGFKIIPEQYNFISIQYVSFVEFSSRANNIGSISGYGTISETTKGATAVGKYNKDGSYLFMVGNGSGHYNRSNAFAVDTNGNTTAKSFNQSSDERLKEHIQELDRDKAQQFIDNVNAVSFNFKGDDKACIGFIAQDIEKYFPEAVTNSEDGYKYLDYSKLIAPLFQVVKQQQKQIAELTEMVNKLNNN